MEKDTAVRDSIELVNLKKKNTVMLTEFANTLKDKNSKITTAYKELSDLYRKAVDEIEIKRTTIKSLT
jgi:hypothetical protein